MQRPAKAVVQIGPVCDDPAESVSAVNRIFIDSLAEQYDFVPGWANRRAGGTQQARFNFTNVYYLLAHGCQWAVALLRRRPAVVHYGLTSGWAMEKGLAYLFLGRVMGAKTIGHLHAGDFIEFWQKLPEKRRARARRQMLQLDALVALSETWRNRLIEHVGIPEKKLHVINNPIARDFEEAALQMPAERGAGRIISIGVMGRDKGVLDLVAASALVAEQTRDFQLTIAGPDREPGMRNQVQTEVSKLGLGGQLNCLGSVWGQNKIDLFKQAGILVLPSYFENFPMVVLEAAAAGQAIITTPVGAIPEFFEDGESAIFVEPGNVIQLASAIVQLLENPQERLRLALCAREVFLQRLARSGIVRNLDKLYRSVLSGN
jgi:glycosyltransferase involved in cell wall biosynthesis